MCGAFVVPWRPHRTKAGQPSPSILLREHHGPKSAWPGRWQMPLLNWGIMSHPSQPVSFCPVRRDEICHGWELTRKGGEHFESEWAKQQTRKKSKNQQKGDYAILSHALSPANQQTCSLITELIYYLNSMIWLSTIGFLPSQKHRKHKSKWSEIQQKILKIIMFLLDD